MLILILPLDGRQLPILTCYIASLPTSFPFRISIHLWTGKAKPSAVIESRKKPNQRVVYTAQVIVDGVRVLCVLIYLSNMAINYYALTQLVTNFTSSTRGPKR